MEQFKNKKVITAVAVFLVLTILGAVFFLTRSKSVPPTPSESIADSELPTLTSSDIGLEVTVRSDGKALMFELAKAFDINSVEYTIEYEKDIDGEKVPEGIFGIMNIAQDGITKTDYREFGTCSSGKCRYDKVISDIKITLKVTKKDGKDYLVEKIVKL